MIALPILDHMSSLPRVLCPVSCVLCPAFCVPCPVSCVLRPVSCVLCPAFCVLCSVSCVLRSASCVLCPVPRCPVWFSTPNLGSSAVDPTSPPVSNDQRALAITAVISEPARRPSLSHHSFCGESQSLPGSSRARILSVPLTSVRFGPPATGYWLARSKTAPSPRSVAKGPPQ